MKEVIEAVTALGDVTKRLSATVQSASNRLTNIETALGLLEATGKRTEELLRSVLAGANETTTALRYLRRDLEQFKTQLVPSPDEPATSPSLHAVPRV